jgi:hypothetical protein
MVNHDQPDQNAGAPSAPAAIPALTPSGAARRRIAGLGVSGVLMTVASSHAMAGELACKSPSGALSGDLHASHAPKVACEGGQSPTWWFNHKNLLPRSITKHTLFSEILYTSRPVGNMTVFKVLEGVGNKGNDTVPALMLATWFNVTVNPRYINFLTPQAVADMWANYDADEVYNISGSSQSMDSVQFAEYLRNTQIA